jgi:hypothetical protein
MTAYLHKAKTALLDHMKTLPDAHITAEEDFVAWGRQFVAAAVSHVLTRGGWIELTHTLARTHITACPIAWDAQRTMSTSRKRLTKRKNITTL